MQQRSSSDPSIRGRGRWIHTLLAIAAHAQTFNVLDYGAVGDGRTDDTLAVRRAAAAVAAAGGGALLLPAHHVFLSQALNLSSHTALLVVGVLRAANVTTLWPLIPPLAWYGGGCDAPQSGAPEWQPFLLWPGGENVSVSGGGTIDGNGGAWWACRGGSPALAAPPCGGFSRPHLLRPTHVRGFALHDVALLDPPAWCVHLANVSGAVLERFSVRAPADVGNTDGTDVDCSRDVTIRDFYYAGGDDAIAIKSGLDWLGRAYGAPTENVLVERLTIRSGNGFAVGSEMSAGVRNVTFVDVDVDCTPAAGAPALCKHGLYIKTVRGRGGVVEDVRVVNASVRGVGFAHGVTLEYVRGVPPTNASATPAVRDVTISGGSVADVGHAFDFQGLPESVVTGVLVRGVVLGSGTRVAGACGNTTGECQGLAAASDCPPCLRNTLPLGDGALIPPTMPRARLLAAAAAPPHDSYTYGAGFLAAGDDLPGGSFTYADALARCDALVECMGVTFAGNEPQPAAPVSVYFKSAVHFEAAPGWQAYFKTPPPEWPTVNATVGALRVSLRAATHTVAVLALSDPARDWSSWGNFSFVPPVSEVGLPGCHSLGDVTLRTQPLASSNASAWSLFSSAWGSWATPAAALPLGAGEFAADDITALLNATPASHRLQPWGLPVRVTRSYADGGAPGHALVMRVNVTALEDVRIGGLGFSMINNEFIGGDLDTIARVNSLADPHIGADHAFVEVVRMTGNESLLLTPGSRSTRMEAWRPLLEDCNFGGWQHEWTVLSGAWAAEWATARQAPILAMPPDLVASGVWGPAPAAPWPAWRGSEVVSPAGSNAARQWNPATALELRAGETATFALRVALAPNGPRTAAAALVSAGEPALRGVPGFTLGTDAESAYLLLDLHPSAPPPGALSASPPGVLAFPGGWVLAANSSSAATYRAAVSPLAPGRARASVRLGDGSEACAHYRVTPPFARQVAAAGEHWANVAWLPRAYPDPFGRSASVMPWDREDGVHVLDDSRAYIVGLSDDAGAAQNLGFATKVGLAPTAEQVARLDEYIDNTLLGVKPDVAAPPLRSLQVAVDGETDAIRMTMYYYCATPGNCTGSGHFPYAYPEQAKCDVDAGSPNWCMLESMADATYRGFNVPHSTAVWVAMYRVARNCDRLVTARTWAAYLERAVALSRSIGQASVGFMDGSVFRELLLILELEAAATGNATIAAWRDRLHADMLARATGWSHALWPYGSEFAYDTTGQEEVFIWTSHFGFAAAANRTLEAVLAYMRHLPNWAWHGGARSGGDLGNNGKWLVNRGGERMLLHYRAGLNQIVLTEAYRANPDDAFLLHTAMGALTGQLGNIDATGAASMGFHTAPFVAEYDPRSGDYGLGFFGISLEMAAFLVRDALLPSGWACFMCNLAPTSTPTAPAFTPTDGYRVRVYLEPLGTSLVLRAGNFAALALDTVARTAAITLAPAAAPGGGARLFSFALLEVRKDAPARPGAAFVLRDAAGVACPLVRGAFRVTPNAADDAPTLVTLSWT